MNRADTTPSHSFSAMLGQMQDLPAAAAARLIKPSREEIELAATMVRRLAALKHSSPQATGGERDHAKAMNLHTIEGYQINLLAGVLLIRNLLNPS